MISYENKRQGPHSLLSRLRLKRARALLLLFIIVLGTVKAVSAHSGGTPQLVNEPAGPYVISVWTGPEPPRVGDVHVSVAVAEPGTGAEAGPPVLDATVDVRMASADGIHDAISGRATTEASANKLFYEVDLAVHAPGTWTVFVAVDGAEGSGEAQFELEVEPEQTINWTVVGVIAVALLAFFLIRRSVGLGQRLEQDS